MLAKWLTASSTSDIAIDTHRCVAGLGKIIAGMRAAPTAVRFADLEKVWRRYFGEPRQQGSSHQVYRMPWAGDPRVNIQDDHGKAKAYQVRQVLAAIKKLEEQP